MFVEKMRAEIEKQLTGVYEYSPIRGCALQLIDIVGNDEGMAQIIFEDMSAGQTVKECEKQIKAFVDKNHKGNVGFCPPQKAEEIIRGFFGLGKKAESAAAAQKSKIISLADLL